MRSLKYFLICLGVVFIPRSVLADIESIYATMQGAVGIPAGVQEQYEEMRDLIGKLNALYTSGRDTVKEKYEEIKGGIEGVKENPKGMLSTFLPAGAENKGPVPEFERMEEVKEYHGRKEGGASIPEQKKLDKAMNEKKFKGLSTLFARSITKRRELLNEESTEPDLSTIAAAQKAIADKLIKSSRRFSYLLQSDAFAKDHFYTIEIQGYNIQEEEEDEE